MSTPGTPPLTMFEGILKRLDLERLTAPERALFDRVFPDFDAPLERSDAAEAGVARGDDFEPPYNYRRFAGGPDLPRGRYGTVCLDDTDDDGGTLAHELLYYANPRKDGFAYLMPGDGDAFGGTAGSGDDSFPDFEPAPNSLVMVLPRMGRRHHPLLDPSTSPLRDAEGWQRFLGGAHRSQGNGSTAVELRPEFRHISCPDVLDLRRAESQRWLNKRLRDGLPNTIYSYWMSDPGIERFEEPDDLPAWTSYASPAYTEDKLAQLVERGVAGRFSSALSAGAGDDGGLKDMFRALCSPQRGGSPITEAIGDALRSEGVLGLVYPSARSDVRCRWEDGVLTEARGWCFLDYRDAGPAARRKRLIYDPSVWFQHAGELWIYEGENGGRGSWEFSGLSAMTGERQATIIRNHLGLQGSE